MFDETLVRGTKDNLAVLGQSAILDDAYLAGGTAAALQMGHRVSIDFDFFTQKEFDPRSFSTALSRLDSFDENQVNKGTLLGRFHGTKFSLFAYPYPLLFSTKKYLSVNIADIRDISAMKIDAIASRGAKRDFVDLYFICRSGHRLSDILDFYEKKYGKLASNFIHIQKSLVFFDDADSEEMPKMLKYVTWTEVKNFFEKEIKNFH